MKYVIIVALGFLVINAYYALVITVIYTDLSIYWIIPFTAALFLVWDKLYWRIKNA